MQNIEFSDIQITGGYWKTRQDINSSVTLESVYERFQETHRFDALKCEWKNGEPNMPHIFWDSDIAKWIELSLIHIFWRLQRFGKAAGFFVRSVDCPFGPLRRRLQWIFLCVLSRIRLRRRSRPVRCVRPAGQ